MGLPQSEGLASIIALWGKTQQTTKQTNKQKTKQKRQEQQQQQQQHISTKSHRSKITRFLVSVKL